MPGSPMSIRTTSGSSCTASSTPVTPSAASWTSCPELSSRRIAPGHVAGRAQAPDTERLRRPRIESGVGEEPGSVAICKPSQEGEPWLRDRLRQMPVEADAPSLQHRGFISESGKRYQPDSPIFRMAANPSGELEAVHLGHHEVDEHQVRLMKE